ncbi:unnamed protein product [Cuscuta europaea]|uniref:Uncharacterized protein n=1 Tax=Cuscuta europaea TaxID=41803 RepID=A0A9P1E7P2_CUSEU|nr:unnamed protein product [Cuscuta europaea]
MLNLEFEIALGEGRRVPMKLFLTKKWIQKPKKKEKNKKKKTEKQKKRKENKKAKKKKIENQKKRKQIQKKGEIKKNKNLCPSAVALFMRCESLSMRKQLCTFIARIPV